jgi:hypothetical protein
MDKHEELHNKDIPSQGQDQTISSLGHGLYPSLGPELDWQTRASGSQRNTLQLVLSLVLIPKDQFYLLLAY